MTGNDFEHRFARFEEPFPIGMSNRSRADFPDLFSSLPSRFDPALGHEAGRCAFWCRVPHRTSAHLVAARDQPDSAAFFKAARVAGIPLCAASVRLAIWARAPSPYLSWNLAMPAGRNSHDSVTRVPPSAGVKV